MVNEFFQSWPRRFGALLLVMACICTVGWIRSLCISEGISYARGKRTVENYFPDQIYYCTEDIIYSEGGFLHWHHDFADERKISGGRTMFDWWTQPLGSIYLNDDDECLKWRWRFCGIRLGEIEDINDATENEFGINVQLPRQRWYFLHVPYWCITFPLTLISCWLLLSKSRKSIEKKLIKPALAGGP